MELQIHEDRMELFEAWFAQEMFGTYAKWETLEFATAPGSYAVLYKIRVSSRSAKTLQLVQDTWAEDGAKPA